MINDAKDIMWLGLAAFLVLAGLGLAYALWRTGRMLLGVEEDLHRTIDEVVPVIAKAAVSIDTVNSQLGKVDLMLDSAVDMTESLDTTVRAVSIAITEPVKKVSGAVAGAGEAVSSFRDRMREGSRSADADAAAGEGGTEGDEFLEREPDYPDGAAYHESSYVQGYEPLDADVNDATTSEDYP
ncbi:MAG: DUF948 domain-containing protein [Thermoleophilia bacterium]|nr:DUF948 domain-containing protein [Thermoleophilia bacterium]